MFISYAQNFEDVMLWRALRHVEGGRYIDIGAQDPNIDSVSLAFYKLGWRGVHVEPIPVYAEALRLSRPDETVIEAAVNNRQGAIEFFEVPNTGLSTGDPGIAAGHGHHGYPLMRREVLCVSLHSLLERYAKEDVHWMKIDVEGMEADVLASWGDAAARPWIIIVESTLPNTTISTHETWEHMLLERGYALSYWDGLNRFYVADQHKELTEKLRNPPNVFDGFSLCGFGSNSFSDVLKQSILALESQKSALEAELTAARDAQVAAQTEMEAQAGRLREELTKERQVTADAKALSDQREKSLGAQLADQSRLNHKILLTMSLLGSDLNQLRNLLAEASASPVSDCQSTDASAAKIGPAIGTSIARVDDLAGLYDEPLVDAAYQLILGRSPDAAGRAHYVGLLRQGVPRETMLAQLAKSEEARSRETAIPGLAALAEAHAGQRPGLIQRLLQRLGQLEHERLSRQLDNLFHSLDRRNRDRLAVLSNEVSTAMRTSLTKAKVELASMRLSEMARLLEGITHGPDGVDEGLEAIITARSKSR